MTMITSVGVVMTSYLAHQLVAYSVLVVQISGKPQYRISASLTHSLMI